MLEPKPAELLAGIIDALRKDVLTALPPGAAQRQLHAALHALSRLQRSWDLMPEYVNADMADIRAALGRPLDGLTHTELQQLLLDVDDEELFERMNERQIAAWGTDT